MKRKKGLSKIKREQLLKFLKQANRKIALESPQGPRGGRHETDKKDIFRKSKNTVKDWGEDV